jgi:hypothetical protein
MRCVCSRARLPQVFDAGVSQERLCGQLARRAAERIVNGYDTCLLMFGQVLAGCSFASRQLALTLLLVLVGPLSIMRCCYYMPSI